MDVLHCVNRSLNCLRQKGYNVTYSGRGIFRVNGAVHTTDEVIDIADKLETVWKQIDKRDES